jgi:hypothetical protein
MAYGGLSRPIKGQLPLPWSLLAFVLFMGLMLGVSIAKTAIAERWQARQSS